MPRRLTERRQPNEGREQRRTAMRFDRKYPTHEQGENVSYLSRIVGTTECLAFGAKALLPSAAWTQDFPARKCYV
ncbi:hypothetical protein C5Y97_24260 [Blastopirellula marina]|uniref:Uncharacterized protein n=1 Tax=Blastopirellula marina TaxID=124 RepID=A0A2S8F9P2_9BACT|nr:hypothetical protein C5Y98_24245 [Blastopirellula marina]PTL42150.1 hypothetical protein C5Y97_24260 [Blastopirellula marina]